MALRLEFLGTGTSQGVPVIGCRCAVCTSTDPYDKRLRSSVWITASDTRILIDAGPDLRQQLLRGGHDRLDAVLLTHEHMDHVAGIDELRAFNFTQRRAMDLFGQPRTLDAVRHMYHYAFSEVRYPGVPELNLRPIGTDTFHIGPVAVTPVEVMHEQLPVLGFRIGDLAYITDAKTIAPAARDRLRGLDVLVLNALRIDPHRSHLNLREALAVVEELAPRRAYFTHISHLMGRHDAASRNLPPGVQLAFDGLLVEADPAPFSAP